MQPALAPHEVMLLVQKANPAGVSLATQKVEIVLPDKERRIVDGISGAGHIIVVNGDRDGARVNRLSCSQKDSTESPAASQRLHVHVVGDENLQVFRRFTGLKQDRAVTKRVIFSVWRSRQSSRT